MTGADQVPCPVCGRTAGVRPLGEFRAEVREIMRSAVTGATLEVMREAREALKLCAEASNGWELDVCNLRAHHALPRLTAAIAKIEGETK